MFKRLTSNYYNHNSKRAYYILTDSFLGKVDIYVDCMPNEIGLDHCLAAVIKYYRTVPVCMAKNIAAYYCWSFVANFYNENNLEPVVHVMNNSKKWICKYFPELEYSEECLNCVIQQFLKLSDKLFYSKSRKLD